MSGENILSTTLPNLTSEHMLIFLPFGFNWLIRLLLGPQKEDDVEESHRFTAGKRSLRTKKIFIISILSGLNPEY